MVAGEEATILGFLNFLRGTIRLKTDGLTDDQLRARLEPSSMTLGGMLKHLSNVEDYWFNHCLGGNAPAEPWASVDWKSAPDWDWDSAADDDGDRLRAMWEAAVAASDAHWGRLSALEGFSLDSTGGPPDEPVSARWVLVHMVEEYARHCGHADLLRESIDGSVGE